MLQGNMRNSNDHTIFGKSCENLKRVMYEYSNGIAKAREYLTSNHLD
jgi:hypothetical protein